MSNDAQVLIVGAGPTGLTAASELVRHGARVRIIDQGSGPSVHSKALVVQPRTLEVFQAMGIAAEVEAAAQPVFGIEAHLDGKPIPMIQFAEVEGPFPRPVMLRQSETERVLAAQLVRQGVKVEWDTPLERFAADDEGVTVTLAHGEVLHVDYLIGCDGAHSRVRKQLGVAFEGSTYENDFVQADCKVRWDLPDDVGQVYFTDEGAIVCLPLGGGSFRIIMIRRERPADSPEPPELEEFQAALSAQVPGVELCDPEWLIRFRLHERLAERFRVGRVFLAGDAAHIHTPAGGQGMNIGIQDAFNLAWKLGLALRGRGGALLLHSYEAERRPIAAEVLRFTDFMFRNALGDGRVLHTLRPILLRLLLGSRAVRDKAARTVAELETNLRKSPIVEERRLLATGPHAGDRAPDATFVRADRRVGVFDVLRGIRHVVFTHRARSQAVERLERELHDVAWVVTADEGQELAERYHLGKHAALWVVRPDGYIGFREASDEVEPVLEWFAQVLGGAVPVQSAG